VKNFVANFQALGRPKVKGAFEKYEIIPIFGCNFTDPGDLERYLL
jgi:hypothetical protein